MDSVFSRPYPFVGPPKYYLRQEHFPLAQSLNRKNGFMVIQKKENLLADNLTKSQSVNDVSSIDKFYQNLNNDSTISTKPFVPKFVELDKKVLKFTAYFVEPVYESLKEIQRIRYVDIYFYLLEETISVVEPKIENCGLVQGKVFIRQKVPCHYDQSKYLDWKDLNVGLDVEMFGRIYTLIDCDSFTKSYCENQGVRINEKEFGPVDPYLFAIKFTSNEELGKIQYDRTLSCLCCSCAKFWDDTLGYDYNRVWRRLFSISFFRSDETFLIKQTSNTYDGLTTTLLNRQKLSKGKSTYGNPQWYSEIDLNIGKWINVNGRPMLIYDCDKWTRNLLNISMDSIDLQKFPPGQLPSMEIEENLSQKPQKILTFYATMNNPPAYLKAINNYIIEFDIERNSVTIWEKKENCVNSKGRLFIGRSQTKLLSHTFQIGRKLKLFRWQFELGEDVVKNY